MNSEQDLMQRLAVSKKIMEKHGEIGRGTVRDVVTPLTEELAPVDAKYNLPEDVLTETTSEKKYHDPTKPLEEERILKSKLPDEIKALMIEKPIVQPNTMGGGTVLSDEIIEGAQRLMGKNNKNSETPQKVTNGETMVKNTQPSSNIDISEIKSMIRDVVRDTVRDVVREELKGAGMLVESTTNTDEIIQFKVGQHLFIGKVTKVKKLEK
jgi:hypothetical protein